MVGIDGGCEAGVGSVDVVAGVFWGVGAAARSSTRLFLMNCFSDMMTHRQKRDGEKGRGRDRDRDTDGERDGRRVWVSGPLDYGMTCREVFSGETGTLSSAVRRAVSE